MRRPLGLLLLAAVLPVMVGCGDDGGGAAEPVAGGSSVAPEGIEGVRAFAIEDNDHVEGPVDYAQSPPVAGPHNPVWANCGVYDGAVPDENAVHSLEHGVVWITYRDTDDATLGTLRQIAAGNDHVLVSAYPDQATPLVLTAWNRQLGVDGVDDPRVEAFVDTYVGADSAPEPGAACDGGAG